MSICSSNTDPGIGLPGNHEVGEVPMVESHLTLDGFVHHEPEVVIVRMDSCTCFTS